MRLYALLFLLSVLRAQAASIPIEEKSSVDVKELNIVGEKESIEQIGKESEVPVAIVDDVQPALKNKIDENSNDYVPDVNDVSVNVKRVEVDLTNPGPPQRQQHETQTPTFNSEREHIVADIEKKLLATANVLKKSVANVNDDLATWSSNVDHLTAIQVDIGEMKNKFLDQIAKLNETLQLYLHPEGTKSVITDPESTNKLRGIQNRLRVLESNFKSGIHILSEGVKALETAKAEEQASAGAGAVSGSGSSENPSVPGSSTQGPSNTWNQYWQSFMDYVSDSIQNMQNQLNNLNPFNQNGQTSDATPPDGAQADETSTTSSPWWQILPIPIGQTASNNNSSNSILQTIQNNVQPFLSIFQPNNQNNPPNQAGNTQTQKSTTPTQPNEPVPVQTQAQTQSIPIQSITTQSQATEHAQSSDHQTGPIRQIVQNNPIVKGIVQRIQSISNQERPREKELARENLKEDTKEKEKAPSTKGHHGSGGSGDSVDDNGITNNAEPIEKQKEVEHMCHKEKAEEVVAEKKEVLPLSDKTE